MSNDQAKQFEEESKRTKDFFSAVAEREAAFFAEETRKSGDLAQAVRLANEERSKAEQNQKVYQLETKQWGRDDLTKVEPAFKVGEVVQAEFGRDKLDDMPIATSQMSIAMDGGQRKEVQIEAVVKLSESQYQSAFGDYGNHPQPFLKPHAGTTAEGLQKAVVVEVPNNPPFVVVPASDGSAQQIGFEPKPVAKPFQMPSQPAVSQPQAPDAGFKPAPVAAPVAPTPTPAQSVESAPTSAPSPRQTSSHNSWGSDGIAERWRNFESDQKTLQRDINQASSRVSAKQQDVKSFVKNNEALEEKRSEFLGRTKGKTDSEIARDPELSKLSSQFKLYDKELEKLKEGVKQEQKELRKQQDEYAINHCKFHSDSWARVRMTGEVVGSKEMVEKANSMQDSYRMQLTEIRERQAAEAKQETKSVSEPLKPVREESATEQVSNAQQFSSLSTDQYIAQEIQSTQRHGESLEKKGQVLSQASLDEMDDFTKQADQALKQIDERKQAQAEKKAVSQ
ncbi:hypothetical protein N7645_15050 [Pseudomonas juntendi]|uniref:hypothetical protein n=1 Tax=Pseudomonas TaxID=286 RepID=UPI0012AE26AC|nr:MULTISPECIES: hypothetical protein [Pseudomonas]MDG9918205.1 hypothetical protein [Pseudomonas juntendi]MDH0507653.1 hypothetical protein [Pseudomonas juntendi]MDH1044865.1 hypothetical protein [Pseudomonas juntendi]MRT62322.1 hypothetical protein [Pseudomonas sp. CAH-1]